jgi:hypothetical protein
LRHRLPPPRSSHSESEKGPRTWSIPRCRETQPSFFGDFFHYWNYRKPVFRFQGNIKDKHRQQRVEAFQYDLFGVSSACSGKPPGVGRIFNREVEKVKKERKKEEPALKPYSTSRFFSFFSWLVMFYAFILLTFLLFLRLLPPLLLPRCPGVSSQIPAAGRRAQGGGQLSG